MSLVSRGRPQYARQRTDPAQRTDSSLLFIPSLSVRPLAFCSSPRSLFVPSMVLTEEEELNDLFEDVLRIARTPESGK